MRPGCPFKQQGTNFVFVKEKLFEKNVHFALLCERFQFLSLISDGDGFQVTECAVKRDRFRRPPQLSGIASANHPMKGLNPMQIYAVSNLCSSNDKFVS